MSMLIRKLSIFLLLSFFLFSCDNGNDNGARSDTDAADFPFEKIMSEEISTMFLSLQKYEEEIFAYINMHIQEEHENVILKIDGNDIQMEGWEGYYYGYLEEIAPEQQITYELDIDGNKREGSLELPSVIHATFQDEFDLSADYTISWEIARDPTLFVAWMDVEMEEEADGVHDINILAGNQRNHTFSQNLYSGVSEESIWYIGLGITALDFELKDDMVFLATFERYHDYDFHYHKRAEKRGRGINRGLRLVK